MICKGIIFVLILGVVFTLVGYTDHLVETTPRNAKILIATHGQLYPMMLVELNGNIVEINVFGVNLLISEENRFGYMSISDDTRLYEFISKSPPIADILPALTFYRIVDGVWTPDVSGYEITNKATIELSQRQLSNIWRLVGNVTRDEPDSDFRRVPYIIGHVTYIWAIIDGELYWSLRDEHRDFGSHLPRAERRYQQEQLSPFVNTDLIRLTNELIDLLQKETDLDIR